MIGLVLAVFILSGCRKPQQPVTITFLDPEGLWVLGDHKMISDAYLQEFTRETGIRVKHLPTPEDNASKLRLAIQLLQGGASSPDVYGVDTIWTESLSNYLIDLSPYFVSSVPFQDRNILDSYMIHGRLVAMPYHPNVQVLIYRTDLLNRYGYHAPPTTWEELEKMAVRIQNGERARGNKDFYGFVWSGAITSEGEQLTCEGLEWQVAEGGGHIVESDGKISVNNLNVVRAWERAAHWIGWISPPGVTAYTDWDAENEFWNSGKAAFHLGWSDLYELHASNKPFRDQAGVTSVPSGESARVATLGGYALGISGATTHRAEAIRLVEFLTRKQAEFRASGPPSEPSRKTQYFEVPAVMKSIYPWWSKASGNAGSEVVSRPSAVAGDKYEAVSQAYSHALHSVLTRKSTAQVAVVALEKELHRIMGNGRNQQGADSH